MGLCPPVAPAGLLTQPLPCYVTMASYSTFPRLGAVNWKGQIRGAVQTS